MAIFDITYVGDMPYLKLEGGTVTGATTFTNNIAASTINGVTVGSDPKFTDTTYSVATTSANGLLPALGGGTTNYLRADGAWAKPPGTTYSVATTSANGLMSSTDKTTVNKIGSGTLNTTNKTIIPAINELKAVMDAVPNTAAPEVRRVYVPADRTSWTLGSNSVSSAAGGWDNYSSITFTVVGEVGDTILIFAVAGGTRNITASSGFTELSSSANNKYYPHAQFVKYKTAASETVTVNISGSASSYYEDFVAVVVIKGHYAIEYAAKATGSLTINKPHQGYYLYSTSKINNGISDLDQITELKSSSSSSISTFIFYDNDSLNKTIGSGGGIGNYCLVAICLQKTGDWGGDSELPIGTFMATNSSYTLPSEVLGYGTWERQNSMSAVWWRRTS